jgi:poly(3-hydroxybutyrate) depolymerase
MRKLTVLFLLAFSFAAASATARPEKQTVTADGKERIYYTFVPEKLNAHAPMLLLLHGSGRDGMSQINEWKGLAEKEGIILAAPRFGQLPAVEHEH